MRRRDRYLLVGLAVAGLGLPGCAPSTVSSADSAQPEPAVVEPIQGTELSRIILTAQASRRLGITTADVRRTSGRPVVPYTALLYDPEGATWVYTNPEPLVYVRHPVTVAHIGGDQTVLVQGPPAGTAVVTVGAAELYGAELGIGQ